VAEENTKSEWLACQLSFPYFVDNFVQIYDAIAGGWIPFKLWPEQVRVANELVNNRLNVILKARQLGLTWLVLSYILWLMLFHPSVTILLFSRREVEAIYLLDKRLKGMYKKLPEWMGVRTIVSDSSHIWELSNGSIAYAFPSTAGDSYTATLAFVDEADLVPDLDALMLAVKPTIDAGGRMILLSRSNKETPNSSFKKLFISSWAKLNEWKGLFLAWFARPTRTNEWYETQKADFLSRTGSLDGLYEQYPETPEEALSPKSLNKRIPYEWLQRCYVPLEGEMYGLIPGLRIYSPPQEGHTYIMSADPAEGNPTSDDSAAHVLDDITLEEVAVFVGKFEPLMFAEYLLQISEHYNDAHMMIERNNHGHAVIATIREKEKEALLMRGLDDKYGWPQTAKSKAFMYDEGVKLLKDGVPTFHSNSTFLQLSNIEGSSLKAPSGAFDDEAVSFILGLVAGTVEPAQNFGYRYAHTNTSRHNPRSQPRRSRNPNRGVGRAGRLRKVDTVS
jgi:hypothetical protein